MRSLADRLRLERVLRAIALASLALWIANAAWPRRDRMATLRGDALEGELPRLTAAALAESVHVHLETVPEASWVEWLAALRGAGVGVSWAGPAGGALALETFRSPEPAGGVVLLAAVPQQSVVNDALGPVDTLAVASAPSFVRLASVEGDVTVRSGLQPVRVAVRPAATPRRVFVSGAAGWETKFAIAALEESGWVVDARMFVRPDQDVVQGGVVRPALDTSRYAAVVLVDSAAAEATRGVVEFARAGGGVVLAGDANRSRRVAPLMGWTASARESAPLGTLPGDTAWRGQSRVPLDTIAERRAVALETRDGRAVIAARRHYAGRVLAIGYDQTWRWRMAGGESAVADHRAWWSRLVASVTARPVIPSEVPSGSAPLATLHDALGPASESPRSIAPRLPRDLLSHVLGLVCLVALLSEWLTRRARGGR